MVMSKLMKLKEVRTWRSPKKLKNLLIPLDQCGIIESESEGYEMRGPPRQKNSFRIPRGTVGRQSLGDIWAPKEIGKPSTKSPVLGIFLFDGRFAVAKAANRPFFHCIIPPSFCQVFFVNNFAQKFSRNFVHFDYCNPVVVVV